MTGRELKEALRAGRRVYGTCIVSTSPAWPPMIAGTGLDFVFIDTEHIPIDRTRLVLAFVALAVFVLSFTPSPIEPMDLIQK